MNKGSEGYTSIYGAVMPSASTLWSDIVEQELDAKTLEDYSYPLLAVEDVPIITDRYFDLSDDSRYALLALSVRYGIDEDFREVRDRNDSQYFLYDMNDLSKLIVSIHSPEWYRHALPAELYWRMSFTGRSFFLDSKRLFIKMLSRNYVSYQERIVPVGFGGFAEVNEFLSKDLPDFVSLVTGRTERARTVGQFVLFCLVERFEQMHLSEVYASSSSRSLESDSRDASLKILLLFLLILSRSYDSARFGEYLTWMRDWLVKDTCDDCAMRMIFESEDWDSSPWNIFPYAWNNSDSISKYMKVDKQPVLFVFFRPHEETGCLSVHDYAHRTIVRKLGPHSFIYYSKFSEEFSLFVNSEIDVGLSGSTIAARILQVIYFCIDAHVKAYKYVLRLSSRRGFSVFLKNRHIDVFSESNELKSFIIPDLLHLRKLGGPLGCLAESFAFLVTTNEVNADIYSVFRQLEGEGQGRTSVFIATLRAHLMYRSTCVARKIFDEFTVDAIFNRFFNKSWAEAAPKNVEHDVILKWAYPPRMTFVEGGELLFSEVEGAELDRRGDTAIAENYIKLTTVTDLLLQDPDWVDSCSYSRDESSLIQWVGLDDARVTYERGKRAPGECAHTPTCAEGKGCNLRVERRASVGRASIPGHGGRSFRGRGRGRGSFGSSSRDNQHFGMRVYQNRF